MTETFGQLIRRMRKERGLVLAKVGKRVGLGKASLSGVETGKLAPPSAGKVRKLAKLFRLDCADLMRLAWLPKVPREIRPLLEVKDASKDQPVADTPLTTEQAGAVFKEVFKPNTIECSETNDPSDWTTTNNAGALPLPDDRLPLQGLGGNGP